MAIRTVEWSSFSKLPCSGCAPANVFLCTNLGNSVVLPAQLTQTRFFRVGSKNAFKYTIIVDVDEVLYPGFSCANITGILCEGCITQFVEQAVADIAPTVFSGSTYQASNDWLANPGVPVELELVLANDNLTRSMDVLLTWGYAQRFSSNELFDFSGTTAQVDIDGVAIADFVNSPAGTDLTGIVGLSVQQILPAPSGSYIVTLAPAQSVTATLTITPNSPITPPAFEWRAIDIFLSGYGVAA